MKNTVLWAIILLLLCSTTGQAQKRPIDNSLIKAIKNSDYKEVQKYIKLGANVNVQDENQATPLMWAIYKSDLKMVKLLIKYGADVRKKGIIYLDEEKKSYYGAPLSIAAGEGKLDIVKFLVEKMGILPKDKQLVKDKGEVGWTALHEACQNGHMDIAIYLIEKGADVNSQVKENFVPQTPTPLICAINSGNVELIKYLLDHKADPNLTDEYDLNPLGYAVIKNDLDLIRLLLKYKADVNTSILNGAGILMLAAYMNVTDIFKYLVWQGAELKSGNYIYISEYKIYVFTLTAMAAAKGNTELLEYLKDSFDFDLSSDKFIHDDKELFVLSPLHTAILTDQTETVQYLINQGCDVNQVEKVNGISPLIYAAYRNNSDLVRFFLEKGADVNYRSRDGYTALTIAARDGYVEICDLLLKKGADPSITDNEGHGPYYYALISEDFDLNYLFNWKTLTVQDKVKFPSSLLSQALLAGANDIAEEILKSGINPNTPDINGNTALYYAVASGKKEAVELLFKFKADLNLSTTENPLCKAIEFNTEIAKILIDKGADINAKSPAGSYPVFYAVKSGNYEILNLLVSKGIDLSKINDTGITALQLAVSLSDILAVKALLAAGAEAGQQNSAGLNAVKYAEKIKADPQIIELLAEVKINPIELIDHQLEYCIVNLIKKHPEYASTKDSNGYPVLHRLVRINAKDIIQKIALYRINLNITDSAGRNALYYAILLGNVEMAKFLASLPIDINAPNLAGENALELAIASGYTDLAKLLTAKGGKIRKNIPVKPDLFVPVGHTSGVMAIDVSPDGKYLLSLGTDNTVRLWEVSSGKEIKIYHVTSVFEDGRTTFYKNSVKFSPDGNRFLINCIGFIEEYDIRTGSKLRVFEASGQASYSADGNYILTAGKETSKQYETFLIEAKSGKVLFKLRYPEPTDEENKSSDYPDGIASFSPDGKIFAFTSNGNLVLCNTSDGSKIKVFNTGMLRSISFSPDGKKMVMADKGRDIRIIDLENGNSLIDPVLHPGAVVCWSPDGKIFASGGHDQLVILWDAESGKKIRELFGHNHHITALDFSPDGKYLFSSSNDQTIIMWEVNTGKKIKVFGSNSWQPRHVAFSPDGKYIVCTGNDYAVKIWDLHQSTTIHHLTGHKGQLFGFVFSPDSVNVLTYSEDRVPRLWNYSTGKRTATFKTHHDAVLGAGFSPDGKYCFSYSNDAKVILWEVASARMILKASQNYLINKANMIIRNQHPSNLFCFTPDSRYFVSGDTANDMLSLLFWDVTNGKSVKKIKFIPIDNRTVKSPVIRYVGLSPDKKWILCAYKYSFNGENYTELLFIHPETFESTKKLVFNTDCGNLSFSPDGKYILIYNEFEKGVMIHSAADGKLLYQADNFNIDEQNNPFSPDGKCVMIYKGNTLRLIDLNNFNQLKEYSPHDKDIVSAGFSPDGKYIVSSAVDNTIKITGVEPFREIAGLVQFGSNDWVVTNEDGLFDASGQAMKMLYYVSGLEVIELDQMKERYYEPNLLPKLLGFNKEKIRDVKTLDEVNLFPDVDVSVNNGNLEINLTNRGGGIGKVVVLVNGKEIASDARGPKADPNAANLKVNLDLKNHPYLQTGKENVIEVKAYNSEGYLVSRGSSVSYNPGAGKISKPPHLYVVACGVSDYTGDQIDLKYAAKDAEDVANALKIGGERLFGTDKTHIYLMTTNVQDAQFQPTKENILRVFEEISKIATSDDVFVLYLSGHGINWGGQDGDFYYLTKDAYTATAEAYGDPKIRKATTISSAELTDLFKKIPALKQVMMIDACASGKAVENLMAKRDISASTLRALDRMKDRIGTYIITGCAADAVSYEASKFGQGLLTYSLLEGIKGISLREDRFIDIAMLFTRAQERVPELAADIGGIQKPQIFSPYGSQSFDIGELTEVDKEKIKLAQPKPMFLMSVFQEEESMDDILGIEKLVDDEFRLISSKSLSPVIFVQAKEFPEAYRMRGQYTVKDEQVEFRINLFKGKEKTGSFTITGNKNKPEEIVSKIVEKALEIAK